MSSNISMISCAVRISEVGFSLLAQKLIARKSVRCSAIWSSAWSTDESDAKNWGNGSGTLQKSNLEATPKESEAIPPPSVEG
ncbi:hypothetical protein P5V15_009220 [Pogonomyrmex californicus]